MTRKNFKAAKTTSNKHRIGKPMVARIETFVKAGICPGTQVTVGERASLGKGLQEIRD